MNRMDPLIAWLRPDDIASALRLLLVLEECGQMSSSEAAEWRRRIIGWATFHELAVDERPNA